MSSVPDLAAETVIGRSLQDSDSSLIERIGSIMMDNMNEVIDTGGWSKF